MVELMEIGSINPMDVGAITDLYPFVNDDGILMVGWWQVFYQIKLTFMRIPYAVGRKGLDIDWVKVVDRLAIILAGIRLIKRF